MNIYEIAAEHRKIFDELSEIDGLTEEMIKDTLSPISQDFQKAAISQVSNFKNIDAEIEAINNAVNIMEERKKKLNEKSIKFKNYLKQSMILSNINKIECPYFEVRLSKGGKSVEIVDNDKIPKEFVKSKVTYAVDKDAIKKAGGCEGAIIKEVWRLTIR